MNLFELEDVQTASELANMLLRQDSRRVKTSVGIGPSRYLTDQVEEQALLLKREAIQPGESIAVRIADPQEFLAVLLAVWLADAVPLVVDHRVSEVAYSEILASLAPTAEVVDFDGKGRPVDIRRLRQKECAHFEGRVMLQLTSGTTGRTRIVRRDLRSLATEILHYVEMPYLDDSIGIVGLACSPFHTFGLIAGLLSGVATTKDLAFLQQLNSTELPLQMLVEPERTSMISVPSVLQMLSRYQKGTLMDSLGRIIFAGERPSARLVERLGDCKGDLVNIFGTTESGLLAASVGPLDNLSPCLTRELRVEKGHVEVRMSEDPYLEGDSGGRWADGWFWTGDIAAVADGGLDEGFRLLGRGDSQISVGGLKINLSRVEDVAMGTGMCRAAVASFNSRVNLYIEVEPEVSLDAFRAALRERLEPREFPSQIHLLEVFPRTFGGKCSRDPQVLAAAAQVTR